MVFFKLMYIVIIYYKFKIKRKMIKDLIEHNYMPDSPNK